jgi:hypothetical protein
MTVNKTFLISSGIGAAVLLVMALGRRRSLPLDRAAQAARVAVLAEAADQRRSTIRITKAGRPYSTAIR